MSDTRDLQPIPDFGRFIERLVGEEGYGLNPCPGRCPYRDDEHAHLRLPPGDGLTFIAWADGRTCGYDLVQPAGAYAPVPVRNAGVLAYDMVLPKWPESSPWKPFRDRIPRRGPCYRADAGFMVHVEPDCRCR